MLVLYSCSVGHEVDKEHRADESYCTEYADRREVLHCVIAVLLQNLESYRVGKRDCWHVERYAEGIESEEDAE